MGHYAVIEIGSNAVRMILGEKEDDSTVKVLRSWSSHFRLGQEVFSKGNISESFQIQLCSILEKLLDQLVPYGACPLQVFGTSAFRDTKNRKEVLQTLEGMRNIGPCAFRKRRSISAPGGVERFFTKTFLQTDSG